MIIKKKRFWLCIIAIISMILLSINVQGGASASVFFGQAPRLVPIYSVDTEEKKVAISFDSAWGADKTQDIIKILKEYNVNATFFTVGFWVQDYPDMVKAIDNTLNITAKASVYALFVACFSHGGYGIIALIAVHKAV